MAAKVQNQAFTETHHALLFAWLSKYVLEQAGEQRGEAVVRKALRQYGKQRGHRMALRAQANGHALSMANYIAYGEFKVSPGSMKQTILEKKPDLHLCVSSCPWHTAWSQTGLMPFGRLYCQEIDEAVVHGFNPRLQLDVHGTRTNGAAQCEFVYHDANLNLLNYLVTIYRRMVRPGAKVVMPWEYHAGHLFSTFERVIREELEEQAQAILDSVLAAFKAQFGEQACQQLMETRRIDYSVISNN